MRPTLASPATLAEFTRFHGMLIAPAPATRCVHAFDGGTILFMPCNYAESLSITLPAKGVSPYEVQSLTTLRYFILVIVSLTGLSTLLGLTTMFDARELSAADAFDDALISKRSAKLPVHTRALEYIARRSSSAGSGSTSLASELRVVRRFEFCFRLVALNVVMLHVVDADEKLHLIEVYDPGPPRAIMRAIGIPLAAGAVGAAFARSFI